MRERERVRERVRERLRERLRLRLRVRLRVNRIDNVTSEARRRDEERWREGGGRGLDTTLDALSRAAVWRRLALLPNVGRRRRLFWSSEIAAGAVVCVGRALELLCGGDSLSCPASGGCPSSWRLTTGASFSVAEIAADAVVCVGALELLRGGGSLSCPASGGCPSSWWPTTGAPLPVV